MTTKTSDKMNKPEPEERSLLQIIQSLSRQAERNWETTADQWTRINSWSAHETCQQIIQIIEKNLKANPDFKIK